MFSLLSIALIIGLYAYDLIFAWTGDLEAANWGSNILLWFSLGNGILAVNTLQFYLQSAHGKLRLHVIGTSFSAIIQVPIIFYASVNYGAEGAGIAWFGFRLVWFLGWTPIVHSKFLPGFHVSWLLKDILPIVIFTVMSALFLKNIFIIDLVSNRALIFLQFAIIGFFLLFGSLLSSRSLRKRAYLFIKMIK